MERRGPLALGYGRAKSRRLAQPSRFGPLVSLSAALAGDAARVETARETIESFETSSSRLVVSFK